MLEPRRSYTGICPNPPWRPVADAFVSQSCATPASCRKDVKFRQFQVSFQRFQYCVFSTLRCLPHDFDQWKYIRHVRLLEELGS